MEESYPPGRSKSTRAQAAKWVSLFSSLGAQAWLPCPCISDDPSNVICRPFQQPKGTEWRNYDVLGEFDFAKRCNESGFVIWSGDERCDFADGLTNEPF
jgi:hypothetical protein